VTLQSAQGWEAQYRRLLRWHERVRNTVEGEPTEGQVDFMLAFFMNCYHLRDWLESSGAAASDDLQKLFDNDVNLSLCRDICNGSKHFRIDRQPVFNGHFAFGIRVSETPSDW